MLGKLSRISTEGKLTLHFTVVIMLSISCCGLHCLADEECKTFDILSVDPTSGHYSRFSKGGGAGDVHPPPRMYGNHETYIISVPPLEKYAPCPYDKPLVGRNLIPF